MNLTLQTAIERAKQALESYKDPDFNWSQDTDTCVTAENVVAKLIEYFVCELLEEPGDLENLQISKGQLLRAICESCSDHSAVSKILNSKENRVKKVIEPEIQHGKNFQTKNDYTLIDFGDFAIYKESLEDGRYVYCGIDENCEYIAVLFDKSNYPIAASIPCNLIDHALNELGREEDINWSSPQLLGY